MTTRPHAHTRTRTREWHNGTIDEITESAQLIALAHAHHDFYDGSPDTNMAQDWLEAWHDGTVEWEYEVPNPMEMWEEVYDPPMWGLADMAKVRTWARQYMAHYLTETKKLMEARLA